MNIGYWYVNVGDRFHRNIELGTVFLCSTFVNDPPNRYLVTYWKVDPKTMNFFGDQKWVYPKRGYYKRVSRKHALNLLLMKGIELEI